MLKIGGNMGVTSSAFTEFLHPLMPPAESGEQESLSWL